MARPTHIAFETSLGVADIGQQSRIDREQRVIYGVKVLGLESRNPGRVLGLSEREFGEAVDRPYAYTTECLRRAISLYEGAAVFSNHLEFGYTSDGARFAKQESHANESLIGWLRNVRVIEGQGLFGDLYYLEAHPLTPLLLEIAERNDKLLALSHEANFDNPQLINGRIYLTEITHVSGVALVNGTPGTTNGLFETSATTEKRTMRLTIRQILESTAQDPSPLRVLLAEAMDSDVLQGGGGQDIDFSGYEMEVPDDSTPEKKIRMGLMAAIHTALEKADVEQLKSVLGALGINDSLTETAAECNDKAVAEEDTAPEKEEEDAAVNPEDKQADEKIHPPAAESAAVAQAAAREVIFECVALLSEKQIPVKRSLLEAMAALPTPERRQAYATELAEVSAPVVPAPKAPAPRSQPAKTPPQQSEAYEVAAQKYANPGAMAEAIRRPLPR